MGLPMNKNNRNDASLLVDGVDEDFKPILIPEDFVNVKKGLNVEDVEIVKVGDREVFKLSRDEDVEGHRLTSPFSMPIASPAVSAPTSTGAKINLPTQPAASAQMTQDKIPEPQNSSSESPEGISNGFVGDQAAGTSSAVADGSVGVSAVTVELPLAKPVPPVTLPAGAPRPATAASAKNGRYSYNEKSQPMNVLAIISLILGILFAPAGIITGHIALRQIAKNNERGRGYALAGTILGWVLTGIALLLMTAIVFLGLFVSGSVGAFINELL